MHKDGPNGAAPRHLGREPVCVIRGDLCSNTGYGRAARALAQILSERYKVAGVSIHVDPSDCSQPFPGELVSQEALVGIAQTSSLLVINHTVPDDFIPVPKAYNVGAFYWETRGIPRRLSWPERIAAMEAIWAPTSFVAGFARSCGFNGPISLVPWPHSFGRGHGRTRGRRRSSREVLLIDRMPGEDALIESSAAVPLSDIFSSERDVFLAIQSLAPRKGLPILIAEWCRFVEETPAATSMLLLKLDFRHAHGIGLNTYAHVLDLLRQYGVAPGQRLRLALLQARLDDDEIESLIDRASCLVSTSYGEGFGGPIVEALSRGVPVIAPRHTGIADLLPDGYAFQVASDELCVALRNNLEVYPSAATWHVPRQGALTTQLHAFSTIPVNERDRITLDAQRHAASFCGTSAVREVVFAATESVFPQLRS